MPLLTPLVETRRRKQVREVMTQVGPTRGHACRFQPGLQRVGTRALLSVRLLVLALARAARLKLRPQQRCGLAVLVAGRVLQLIAIRLRLADRCVAIMLQLDGSRAPVFDLRAQGSNL